MIAEQQVIKKRLLFVRKEHARCRNNVMLPKLEILAQDCSVRDQASRVWLILTQKMDILSLTNRAD